MTIEAALCAKLNATAGITGLVSSRIYPVTLPEGAAMPALVYAKVSGPRIRAMGGANPGGRPRFQLTCWGATYADARAVATQVQAALEGFAGTLSGLPVRAIQQENDLDLFEDVTGRFMTVLDFTVFYEGA